MKLQLTGTELFNCLSLNDVTHPKVEMTPPMHRARDTLHDALSPIPNWDSQLESLNLESTYDFDLSASDAVAISKRLESLRELPGHNGHISRSIRSAKTKLDALICATDSDAPVKAVKSA